MVLLVSTFAFADDWAQQAQRRADEARMDEQRRQNQRLESQRLENQRLAQQQDNQRYYESLRQRDARDDARARAQREQTTPSSRPAPAPARRRSQDFRGNHLSEELISAVENANERITDVALGPNGSYVVLKGRNGYDARHVPPALIEALKRAHERNDVLRHVSLGTEGRWSLVRNHNEFDCSPLAPDDLAEVQGFAARGERLELIEFVPKGVIFASNKQASYGGEVSKWLLETMLTAVDRTGHLTAVWDNGTSSVVVIAPGVLKASSRNAEFIAAVTAGGVNQVPIVALGPGDAWLVISDQP